jgi:hypothetical protein
MLKWFKLWKEGKTPADVGTIDKEQAIKIAESEAARQGWKWEGGVHVYRQGVSWHVTSNFPSKGGNVRVVIDRKTGQVVNASWISGCPAPQRPVKD